jgi:hypothetical protein
MTIGHHEAAWRFPESSLTGTWELAHYVKLAQVAELPCCLRVSKTSSITWCLSCASAAYSGASTPVKRCATTMA